MPPKIMITGASGFLGGHIAAQALAAGFQVHALARTPEKLAALAARGVQVHAGDLLDQDSLTRAFASGFDALFHVAADTNTYAKNNALQTRINIDGMCHVIQAAKGKMARVIDTSSTAVFGFCHDVITEKTSKAGAQSWINYARSKAIAEQMLLDSALNVVVMNPAHIVGPGDRHNWARLFQLIDQDKLPGAPPGSGSFADVRAVAAAHLAALEHGKPGENYILGGQSASFLEFAGLICASLGKPALRRTLPAWLLQLVAHGKVLGAKLTGTAPDMTPESAALTAHHMRLDCSKAQRELGLTITPLPQLVADTVAWMRLQGMLRS
jgi:dihydroflavonol-4-reductase